MLERLLCLPHRLAVAASLGLCLLAASPARADLRIHATFLGGTPPANAIGGGDIEELMEVAIERWEKVLKGTNRSWDLSIEYRWDSLAGYLFGQAYEGTQGGRPVRITSGEIVFNNTPQDVPFLDPTPRDDSEFTSFSSFLMHDVPVNTGRVFTEAVSEEVMNATDLLTIVTHEIGHLLGLSPDYEGFKEQCRDIQSCFITITAPRPFAGLLVPIQNGPHLSINHEPLMTEYLNPGRRRLISALDVLVIAQLTSVRNPKLGFTLGPPW